MGVRIGLRLHISSKTAVFGSCCSYPARFSSEEISHKNAGATPTLPRLQNTPSLTYVLLWPKIEYLVPVYTLKRVSTGV